MRMNLPGLRFPQFWRALAILATVVVVVLSLIPKPPEPPGFLAWDKAQHFTAYGGLAGIWLQATSGRRTLAVICGLLALGATMEWLQSYSAFRTTDVMDMLANTVGVGIGTVLCLTPLGRLAAGAEWLMLKVLS